MIIFNLWAAPVGILVLFILYVLGRVWPALMQSPLEGWTTGAVFVVVGGCADFLGLKARVFFMPIWLIGLGVIAYQLGVIGTVFFLVLLVAGMVWIQRKTKKAEERTWQDLQYAAPTHPPPVGADETAFWSWVKAQLFLPVCSDYTPDVCAHDLRVLKLTRESGIPLSAEEIEKIHAQESFLETARSAAKPPGVEPKVQRPMEQLVEKRLRDAQEKPRAQRTESFKKEDAKQGAATRSL